MDKPLYKRISDEITENILKGVLSPGERIPSERELADTYHVSMITSKNALNNLAEQGYIIRKKGKGSFVNSAEYLKEISDFVISSQARIVMKAKTIGLIMPSMKTAVDQDLLNAIEYEITKTDYILAISITRENQRAESDAIEKFKQRGVSGLIIFPTEAEIYNDDIIKLNMSNFPFVLVDRYLKGIHSCRIYTDNYNISGSVTFSV